MQIKIIRDKISKEELLKLAQERYGDMVKAVIDIKLKIMAIGGEMHADEEAILLQEGSVQADLWGINLYPEQNGDDFIEFDSMINVRPNQENKTRGVDNEGIREEIKKVVYELYS